MKRRNPFSRWIQKVAMSTESVTAHGIQQELEAIVDRRGSESARSTSSHRTA